MVSLIFFIEMTQKNSVYKDIYNNQNIYFVSWVICVQYTECSVNVVIMA